MIIEAVRKIIEAVRLFVEAARVLAEAIRGLRSSANKSFPIDPRLQNNFLRSRFDPVKFRVIVCFASIKFWTNLIHSASIVSRVFIIILTASIITLTASKSTLTASTVTLTAFASPLNPLQ